MSNLSRIPKEFNSYITSISNPEEQQSAIEVVTKLLPTLERKRHTHQDNLLIAAGLYEIRQKHGYKSEVYQTILEGIAKSDDSWSKVEFRREWLDAYNGYLCLPGSEEDKACILKMNPSRSALAAVRLIPDHKVYNFFVEVRKAGVFPTAAAVEKFAKQGRLHSKPQPVVQSGQAPAGASHDVSGSPAGTPDDVHDAPRGTTMEHPIIDVEAAPVVQKEIPTAQELEQLESANVETSAIEGETETPIDDGKFPNISEPTTTTIEEPTLLDELNTIFSAYESVVKAHRQEIKDDPRALAVIQCLSTFTLQWLNVEPSHLRR